MMRLIASLSAALILIVSISIPSVGARAAASSNVLIVYAATSLTEAVGAAINRYRQANSLQVDLIAGQSTDFAKRIEKHGPANIFVSASGEIVAGLIAKGLVDPDATTSPIGNDLVLVAPIGSQLQSVTISPESNLTELLGPNGSLAVGDPDYTPIGIYAMASLTKLGQWNLITPRLLRAPSAAAAFELVEKGQAPLGIAFSTAAAASKKVKVLGRFPRDGSVRIRYIFAIVKENDSPETRKLFQFLTGAEALQIYSNYGFVIDAPASPLSQSSKPR
jgi:molybdate transport system substrate-binding protein